MIGRREFMLGSIAIGVLAPVMGYSKQIVEGKVNLDLVQVVDALHRIVIVKNPDVFEEVVSDGLILTSPLGDQDLWLNLEGVMMWRAFDNFNLSTCFKNIFRETRSVADFEEGLNTHLEPMLEFLNSLVNANLVFISIKPTRFQEADYSLYDYKSHSKSFSVKSTRSVSLSAAPSVLGLERSVAFKANRFSLLKSKTLNN